jgi:hypothetical protein
VNCAQIQQEAGVSNVRRFALGLAIASAAAIVVAEALPPVTFENFIPGSPHGQFGWKSSGSFGSSCAPGGERYDHMIDSNRTGFTSFGLKSLRMSNAVTSNCLHDQTFSAPVVQEAGETTAADARPSGGRQPYFVFEVDFASTLPFTSQEGLNVAVSADNDEGARMSWLEVADAADGLSVTFIDFRNNNFVSTTVASGLDRTKLHHLRVDHFFHEGPANDVVILNVDDGDFVHRGTSWEDFYRTDPSQQTPGRSRVVRSLLFHTKTTRGTAPKWRGFGFEFDNVEQASGPVPVASPTDKDQCKKGGFRAFNNPSFRNQGECVAFVEAHEHDGDHGRGDRERHH